MPVRVKQVVQPIADQAPADAEQDDRQAGGYKHPPINEGVAVQPDDPVATVRKQTTPDRAALQVDEGERSLERDHGADIPRDQHDYRRQAVRDQVAQEDAQPACAQRAGGFDEFAGFQAQYQRVHLFVYL